MSEINQNKSKTPIIITIVVVAVLAIAAVVYFTTKPSDGDIKTAGTPTDNESSSDIPTTIDGLMAAFAAGSAINCEYTINMAGEYKVIQQIEAGGKKIKTMMNDNASRTETNSLSIEGDAIYSWGATAGEEFATKTSWDILQNLKDTTPDLYDTQAAIEAAKDTIVGLTCSSPVNLDFSVPNKNWLDYSSYLN